ncbi:hypothetical protein HYDPIDRAFT_108215 [Hydnomerulius pinastri MD-312]|nr:hypothetical protein HYDPIDRAFT_108215 [Hydnomerulius pinastri MD-312]
MPPNARGKPPRHSPYVARSRASSQSSTHSVVSPTSEEPPVSRSPSVAPSRVPETSAMSNPSIRRQLPGPPGSTPRYVVADRLIHGPAVLAAQEKLREMHVDSPLVDLLIDAVRPKHSENLYWARESREIAGIVVDAVSEELEAARKQLEKSQRVVALITNKIDSLSRQLDQATNSKMVLDVLYECIEQHNEDNIPA